MLEGEGTGHIEERAANWGPDQPLQVSEVFDIDLTGSKVDRDLATSRRTVELLAVDTEQTKIRDRAG